VTSSRKENIVLKTLKRKTDSLNLHNNTEFWQLLEKSVMEIQKALQAEGAKQRKDPIQEVQVALPV
jgi:hypothetical protein